ncbi:hypothetical protein [Bizionia sp.]|uniref:hypothetical protein n=1 Tax=Bizionia sp. TaxID=1954480 RepID=UPI003A95D38C
MNNNGNPKSCLSCEKLIVGRSDKRFCDSYCRSSYHYKKNLDEAPRFYNLVDNQLKKNRRILKSYNKSGLATVRSQILLGQGFNPNFFTHYWKNANNDIYLFVYEFGFLKKDEKFILIKWQDYMLKKVPLG